MRILWIGRNDQYSMSSRLYYLRCALAEQAEVIPVGPGFQRPFETDVAKLVKDHDIDVVFFRGAYVHWDISNPLWKNLADLKVPTAFNYSDPQSPTARDQRVAWLRKNKIDITFHYVNQSRQFGPHNMNMSEFHKFMPKGHKIVWLPPAVNIEVFKDYGLDREIDVCFLGRIYWLYPLRKEMRAQMMTRHEAEDGTVTWTPREDLGFKLFHRDRPRRTWYDKESAPKVLMQDRYAKAVANSKLFAFDSSKYNFMSMKYLEGLACKTVPIADTPLDAEALGIFPGKHFIEVNKDNFLEKVRYYLDNPKERRDIAQAGYEVVRKHHTTAIRARQLIQQLEDFMIGRTHS